MSATDEKRIRFRIAMVKAAVQIVCEERGLGPQKDIDELAKFIVLEKGSDYGYLSISRKDHLPCIISDFLGEAVWAEKKTENNDDGTAKLLVKIKDNVWQVDFKDFCKNGATDLSVKKLEKCKDRIDYENEPCAEEKNRIENILKDFKEHKSNKEKQGLEEVKKNDNMIQTSTRNSKKLYNKLLNQRKDAHFLDCLFGRWPKEYYDVNDRNVISEKGANYTKFHACTQPAPSFHK